MARRERSMSQKGGTGRKIARHAPDASGRRGSRHLFQNWGNVARRLRAAGRIALFLDFDGTLAPICPHPEQVSLAPSTRRVLKRLARRRGVHLWIISGRRAAGVRRHVRVPGIACVGLHGWERGARPRKSETQRFVQRLRRDVEAKLEGLDGVWVKDKFIGFAVHYRRASAAAVREARATVREAVAPHSSKLRVMDGKKVWEILPLEVQGKGEAVRALLGELKGPALAIYVGDDTTDEAAFRALPRGLTVRVGVPRRTHARYELRNPDEVREFLERLQAERSLRRRTFRRLLTG